MRLNTKLLLVFTIIIVLISCNGKGDKFVGTWADPYLNRPARDLIIIKHVGGNNYLVLHEITLVIGTSILDDSYTSFKDTATLNGDNLVIPSTTRYKHYGAKVTLSIVNNSLWLDSKEYEKE